MTDTKNKPKIKTDIIVLMAGQGKRMGSLTDDRPKALLRAKDGDSIFAHIAKSFAAVPLDPLMIPVVGHGITKVEEEMEKLKKEIHFHQVYNPFYKTTGPLISLWLGLLVSQRDNVIIINGDTIIQSDLSSAVEGWLRASDDKVVGLCVSRTQQFQKDDMKVSLDGEKNFQEVGKHIQPDANTLKSAGVFIVKGREAKEALRVKVDEILKSEKAFKTSYHWHNLVNEMSVQHPVKLIPVDQRTWCEMDTQEEFRGMDIS